jgi:hypothetical protein
MIFADLTEELFHLARRLVHVDDFPRLATHAGPGMPDIARKKDALTILRDDVT